MLNSSLFMFSNFEETVFSVNPIFFYLDDIVSKLERIFY